MKPGLSRRIALSSLLLAAVARSQILPQPPCGSAPWPAYPDQDGRPEIQTWENLDWHAPECVEWEQSKSATLVATAARFRSGLDRDGLLRRIGAISKMAGIDYWSTTYQQWRTLITSAQALSSENIDQRRPDFSPAELAQGKPVFFLQEDSTFGQGVYKLRVREAAASRIVFDSSNAAALRLMLVPIILPGDLESVTFLDRGSKGI